MTFERTDFVSVPVQDMDRARAFYRDTLRLHSPDWDENWPEIETGNVSLYLVDPTQMGNQFAPHSAPIALRVSDVPEAKRELEQRGVQFAGEHDTGVCKMAFFTDSEGNALMLHRRYAPLTAPRTGPPARRGGTRHGPPPPAAVVAGQTR